MLKYISSKQLTRTCSTVKVELTFHSKKDSLSDAWYEFQKNNFIKKRVDLVATKLDVHYEDIVINGEDDVNDVVTVIFHVYDFPSGFYVDTDNVLINSRNIITSISFVVKALLPIEEGEEGGATLSDAEIDQKALGLLLRGKSGETQAITLFCLGKTVKDLPKEMRSDIDYCLPNKYKEVVGNSASNSYGKQLSAIRAKFVDVLDKRTLWEKEKKEPKDIFVEPDYSASLLTISFLLTKDSLSKSELSYLGQILSKSTKVDYYRVFIVHSQIFKVIVQYSVYEDPDLLAQFLCCKEVFDYCIKQGHAGLNTAVLAHPSLMAKKTNIYNVLVRKSCFVDLDYSTCISMLEGLITEETFLDTESVKKVFRLFAQVMWPSEYEVIYRKAPELLFMFICDRVSKGDFSFCNELTVSLVEDAYGADLHSLTDRKSKLMTQSFQEQGMLYLSYLLAACLDDSNQKHIENNQVLTALGNVLTDATNLYDCFAISCVFGKIVQNMLHISEHFFQALVLRKPELLEVYKTTDVRADLRDRSSCADIIFKLAERKKLVAVETSEEGNCA